MYESQPIVSRGVPPVAKGLKAITIEQSTFQMTQGEWEQLKAWLRGSPPSMQGQTAAVQWWSSQYGVPGPKAYYHINVLQAGLMTGHLQ